MKRKVIVIFNLCDSSDADIVNYYTSDFIQDGIEIIPIIAQNDRVNKQTLDKVFESCSSDIAVIATEFERRDRVADIFAHAESYGFENLYHVPQGEDYIDGNMNDNKNCFGEMTMFKNGQFNSYSVQNVSWVSLKNDYLNTYPLDTSVPKLSKAMTGEGVWYTGSSASMNKMSSEGGEVSPTSNKVDDLYSRFNVER